MAQIKAEIEACERAGELRPPKRPSFKAPVARIHRRMMRERNAQKRMSRTVQATISIEVKLPPARTLIRVEEI
jgi:hypothetical protein